MNIIRRLNEFFLAAEDDEEQPHVTDYLYFYGQYAVYLLIVGYVFIAVN